VVSSVDVWKEARRRCLNHLRQAFVEQGIKPSKVAKMNLNAQVDELMAKDDGEYVRVAFVKLKVKTGLEDDDGEL
jgi:hypothetical protein